MSANRALPNTVIRIRVNGLDPAIVRRVQGNLSGYGPGGGTEFLFDRHIPARAIEIFKKFDK